MPTRAATVPPLALDRLGWRQFDDLCELLLELESGAGRDGWTGGEAHDRHLWVPAGLSLTGVGPLPGPCRVQTAWLPASVPRSRESVIAIALHDLARRMAGEAGSVVLLSNVDSDPGSTPSPGAPTAPEREVEALAQGAAAADVSARAELLGPRWISGRVDALPGLRRALPSLLSTGALERWVPDALRDRCTLDVGAARSLAEVFVPTGAYRRALRVLDAHHFAVLTGPPEMGKTSIARMIALAMMTDGWEAHECTNPDQVMDVLDRDRAQVFVADDAFGSTEYQPDAAERWARAMEPLLRSMDGRHWLIWTSRPTPLHAGLRRIHRERGAERFPQPAAVLVNADALALDEKVLLLLRHGQGAAPQLRHRLRAVGYEVVSHSHFTPERIRRLLATQVDALAQRDAISRWEAIERRLRTPTAAMAASFSALSEEQQWLLFALLDAPAGPLDHRELAHLARLHHPEGLSRAPSELVDRLTDHFLRVTDSLKVDWVHPSWRDLVIDQLRADAQTRERFLTRCTIEGLLLAISRGGGSAGERTLALIIGDRDWDLVTDRALALAAQASDHDVARLLLGLAQVTEPVLADPATDRRHERSELEALDTAVLTAVSRRAQRAPRALDVDMIGAWFELRRYVEAEPVALGLGVTWTELLPALDPDLSRPAELTQALQWLELADLLRTHAPRQLQAFGFPDGHRQRLSGLLGRAGGLLAAGRAGQLRPRLAQVMLLCRRLTGSSPAELRAADTLIWEASEAGAAPPTAPFEGDVRRHVQLILEDL